MGLVHKNGDMFSAPPGGYFAQANNCQGKMGSGIAKTFKDKYHNAFLKYEKHCLKVHSYNNRSPLVGSSFLAIDDKTGFKMLCLFTSDKYGPYVDPPPMIIEATRKAVLDFLQNNEEVKSGVPVEVHSPKINSNLFRVPWAQTEDVLVDCLKQFPNVTWTVWTY